MNKQAFLDSLRKNLSGLPQEDIEERVMFYSEMIDDRIEEGLSEEEAVSAVGSIDEKASQEERNISQSHYGIGLIVLLVLGSPIWLSLCIVAIAVAFAVFVSLWAIFVSLAAGVVGGVVACITLLLYEKTASGLAMLACGIVCAGLSIFMFYACLAVTKGTMLLTKKIALWIRKCFVKKEGA